MKRECLEEIGCNVEIIKEIGQVIEYRKKFNIKQTSFCYLTRLLGKKGIPKLEPSEIEEGFETVWLSFEDALDALQNYECVKYQVPYIVARDIVFIKEARKLSKK